MEKYYIFVPNLSPIITHSNNIEKAYEEMLKIYKSEFSNIRIRSYDKNSIFIDINYNGKPYRCSVAHYSCVDESAIEELYN